MSAPSFSPRLHVLLARDSPRAVVLRRGPSKQVCTFLWDRRSDTFLVGQWLKGRIYERRSDISPDGKFMIVFAMNGKWKSETGGSWTAISRAPYLKAVVLLGKGDCWHGGGLFTGKRSYWLNDGYGHQCLRQSTEVSRDEVWEPSEYFGGECPGVYYPRLSRDGWTLVEGQVKLGKHKCLTVFEKRAPRGWILRKLAHEEVGAPPGKGCYWDEHELIHSGSGRRLAAPDWEWAEVDGKRLVWAAEGRLHAAELSRDGVGEERVLHDFNGLTFEAIEAPY